jgi:hypothetical protein
MLPELAGIPVKQSLRLFIGLGSDVSIGQPPLQ